MVFQGKTLITAELIEYALSLPEPLPFSDVGLRHEAVGNAQRCAEIIATGGSLGECWRFGVLQTLDHYMSTLRRGGVTLACKVFSVEPSRTGAAEIDAAFAALAHHLSERDGWQAPEWVFDKTRTVDCWFAMVPQHFWETAKKESPEAFRSRGIFITEDSLARA